MPTFIVYVAILCMYLTLGNINFLDYVGYRSGPFFLLSVWFPRKKERMIIGCFFKQLVLTCTAVLMNILGLDRYNR